MPDRLIRLGHSPDPDDAFMFHALADELIPTDGFRFEHVLRDIETLNDWAREGRLEVTAVSVHAYAYLSERYRLLPHGASMGEQYGPMVVVREDARIEPAELPRLRVAIPGVLTSAFLELQLAVGRIADPVIVPFDRILDVVEAGEVDAGLVIHEGQLTYRTQGLRSIIDLGEWWHELTGGLPLPLGANAVRRDLDEGDTMPRLSRILRDSIAYGLEHRQAALAYAEGFGRGLDTGLADRFVGMYVNERTLDYGEDGRAAVAELLRRGHEAGLIDRAPVVDFVED
ncbi:menaquinone biosynthesis family protein [Miltoncostaea oceani]|uniref:menaquinone biosynthesis family protein n=1 Tax=Miltoncostaea oceani TaxID=2843216 RepID=UPI001C3C95FC|nr:MqnA/MqnD/SBP family protein [Miltoncostaea oceani]